MIPGILSCRLCSLAPSEVRRSMTVDLYVNERVRLRAMVTLPSSARTRVLLTAGAPEMLQGKVNLRHLRAEACSVLNSPCLENSPLSCSRRANCARSTLRPHSGIEDQPASSRKTSLVPENAGRAPRTSSARARRTSAGRAAQDCLNLVCRVSGTTNSHPASSSPAGALLASARRLAV